MRSRWVLLFVALVVLGGLGSAFVGPSPVPDERAPPVEQLVRPDGTGSALWPYTSRSRSVEGRTLALNVVVLGEPGAVRRALANRSDANWTGVSGHAGVGDPPWRPARGAVRYTYVAAGDTSGRWVESEYQLGTGTYLGRRVHLRAYPGPAGSWTALQAHTEYWDWFRLRHTVTGVAPGARFLERDLRDEPFVAGISRVYHGQYGGGSDGWMTVVEFAPAAVLLGVALPVGRREWAVADLAVPLALVAVVLGVRAAGLAAESLLPAANPKLFAAVLFPVLAAGPPGVVAVLAGDRPATRTALLAAAGLGAGIVLDLGGVGVRVIPVRLALHRTALVGAIGLFALGVARRDRRVAGAGLAAWVGLLAASLAGLV